MSLGYIYTLVRSIPRKDTTVDGNLALHAIELTRCELGHASIVGVIHEVIYKKQPPGVRAIGIASDSSRILTDGVNTSRSAGVTASWTTKGGRSFGRSVINEVTITGAATLEGMVETNPVASFVCKGLMNK